ncbi:Uncharacterised protein [Acinetobacter baumannii]|nr:Uncharacterised protein [Acinetobacter baumannii]
MGRADHHRSKAVVRHLAEQALGPISRQRRMDPCEVRLVVGPQALAQLPRLHPPAAVQDEACPVGIRHDPVDVAGDQQPDRFLGAARPGEAGFEQRRVLADPGQVQFAMDAFLVAEMVVEATDARSGTVADHLDGGGVYAMLAEAGQGGLENLVFAGRTAHVGPCR